MTDDQRQRLEAAVSGALRHVAFYNLDSTDTRAAKRVLNQSLTPVIDAMLRERDAKIAKLKSIISGKTFPFDESAARIAELEGLLLELHRVIVEPLERLSVSDFTPDQFRATLAEWSRMIGAFLLNPDAEPLSNPGEPNDG